MSNPFVSAVGESEAFVGMVLKPLGFMRGQNHNFLKVSAAFRKHPHVTQTAVKIPPLRHTSQEWRHNTQRQPRQSPNGLTHWLSDKNTCRCVYRILTNATITYSGHHVINKRHLNQLHKDCVLKRQQSQSRSWASLLPRTRQTITIFTRQVMYV